MSATAMMTRPCVITTRTASGTTDELGNEVDGETFLATVCEIQQQRTDEPANEGELSRSDWVGFFPAGTPLNTASSVDAEGLGRFELVGAPMPWRDPLTDEETHIEAELRRIAGASDQAGS